MWKLITGHTTDVHYTKEAEKLIVSARKLSVPLEVIPYEPESTWLENIYQKANIILGALQQYPEFSIIWIDADAQLVQIPTLFDTIDADLSIDLAAHFKDGEELLTSTIFFRNSDKVHAIIKNWIEIQKISDYRLDQSLLHQLLYTYGPVEIKGDTRRYGEYLVKDLPAKYALIFDSTLAKQGTKPVVQQNQASRRFKDLMDTNKGKWEKPRGVRQAMDGSYWIPKSNAALEAIMDASFLRVKGELRWEIQIPSNILAFENKHKDLRAHIIGKGPTLDTLTADDFPNPNEPIYCINDSIHAIEALNLPNPTYCIQQDASLKDSCKPKKATLLIAYRSRSWYHDYPNKLTFYSGQFDLPKTLITVCVASRIAKLLGATEMRLVAFDACVTKDTTYAKCIGYSSAKDGNADRFLGHRKTIDKYLADYEITWLTR